MCKEQAGPAPRQLLLRAQTERRAGPGRRGACLAVRTPRPLFRRRATTERGQGAGSSIRLAAWNGVSWNATGSRSVDPSLRIRCTRPASSTNRARPASLVVVVNHPHPAPSAGSSGGYTCRPSAPVGTHLLVEPEVDAAVDAGVVDVVGDVLPRGVVEDQAQLGIGQSDGKAVLAEGTLEHRAGGAGQGCVGRRVTRERWRGDQREPGRIRVGVAIVVEVCVPDRCNGPPAIVEVLGVEHRDRAVGHGHRQAGRRSARSPRASCPARR